MGYMSDARKNLKVSEETYEKLKDRKLDGETWDRFLSRCVDIDSIESMRDYLGEEMGKDRPELPEVIDVFISTRNHPSHAYWELMAPPDSHPAEFALLTRDAIDDTLSSGMGQVGMHSRSSPLFVEESAIDIFTDFNGLQRYDK